MEKLKHVELIQKLSNKNDYIVKHKNSKNNFTFNKTMKDEFILIISIFKENRSFNRKLHIF